MDTNKHEMDEARHLTQRRGTCRKGARSVQADLETRTADWDKNFLAAIRRKNRKGVNRGLLIFAEAHNGGGRRFNAKRMPTENEQTRLPTIR
jgi:hypothetical protein